MGNPIPPKASLTFTLPPELRASIEAARKRLARGGELPSAGAVARMCLEAAVHTLGC